jgi:hypothetical protein
MQTFSDSKICKTPSITSKKQIRKLTSLPAPGKDSPSYFLEQQVVMFDEI